MTERLLKARDVAERVGVEMGTVLDWHQQGKLPAIRLGGGPRGPLRWPESDLEAALQRWHTGQAHTDGPAALPGPGPGPGGISSRAPRTLRPVGDE
jgi:predicted DNA-binding transcriptional regulator AlpA